MSQVALIQDHTATSLDAMYYVEERWPDPSECAAMIDCRSSIVGWFRTAAKARKHAQALIASARQERGESE